MVLEDVEFLSTSRSAAAQEAYEHIPQFIDKADKAVKDLIKFLEDNIPNSSRRVLYRLWTDDKIQKRLAAVKESINEARQNLHTALSSANL